MIRPILTVCCAFAEVTANIVAAAKSKVFRMHVLPRAVSANRLAGFWAGCTEPLGMMKFAIFDHLDSDGGPLGQFFENRLRLLELIEQSGFHAYHMAEHHSTPLGMAGSPSVFLAAAIQRTSKIRIGPLVYVLPLHHPLRLYEEICMLDHLSRGRLTVGVGRGGALIEHQRLGVDPALAPAMYHEAFSVLMRAFETDVVDFEGRFY